MTHLELVKNHLRERGEITSWEAISNYRITRLSEYIRQLRHELNWEIESIPEKNDKSHWVRYKVKQMSLI